MATSFPDYGKTYAYHYLRDGETMGRTIWADTLDEITEADARPGWHVAYVEEGFFVYEKENEYRLAWRIRGRVRRRLWAAEYQEAEGG
jgi:hypothetical protein